MTFRAPAVVGSPLETRLRRLRRLVLASCSNAFVLLMPVHAGGPPDLDVAQAITAPGKGAEEKASPQAFPMEEFLDRLMIAESGGRPDRKNPRSTALGPFQFVKSTFLFVVSKSFPSEVASLTEQQVLALRADMVFSRRAARAYSSHLITYLKDKGLPATTVNVRIAFLVGPAAAARLLRTPPDQPLRNVLSTDAIAANPYMSGATVADLVQQAAADVGATAATGRLAHSTGESAGTPVALKVELAITTVASKRESVAAPAPSTGEPAATPVALKVEPAATPALSRGEPAATPVALRVEPAATPVLSTGEPAGTPVALRVEPAATPAASKGEPTSAKPPFEIKCKIGLASCRRWIALQERKARLLLHSAQR